MVALYEQDPSYEITSYCDERLQKYCLRQINTAVGPYDELIELATVLENIAPQITAELSSLVAFIDANPFAPFNTVGLHALIFALLSEFAQPRTQAEVDYIYRKYFRPSRHTADPILLEWAEKHRLIRQEQALAICERISISQDRGSITVTNSCMNSAKTLLLENVRQEMSARGYNVMARIMPALRDAGGRSRIGSGELPLPDGLITDEHSLRDLLEHIRVRYIGGQLTVLTIDEFTFLSISADRFAEFLSRLMELKVHVVIAGLNADYLNRTLPLLNVARNMDCYGHEVCEISCEAFSNLQVSDDLPLANTTARFLVYLDPEGNEHAIPDLGFLPLIVPSDNPVAIYTPRMTADHTTTALQHFPDFRSMLAVPQPPTGTQNQRTLQQLLEDQRDSMVIGQAL